MNCIESYFNISSAGDNLPVLIQVSTRSMLPKLWSSVGYKSIVEVGVKSGEFSLEILQEIPGCKLIGIDPWLRYPNSGASQSRQEWRMKKAQRLVGGRAELRRQSSAEAVRSFAAGSLDAVFIDGDHRFDYVVHDIIEWSKRVRSGGMLCVHDYCASKNSGVMPAVNAYTHCHGIDRWYVTEETYPTAFWLVP